MGRMGSRSVNNEVNPLPYLLCYWDAKLSNKLRQSKVIISYDQIYR
jgi:hypothetical protein